jgi:hypothetical protein
MSKPSCPPCSRDCTCMPTMLQGAAGRTCKDGAGATARQYMTARAQQLQTVTISHRCSCCGHAAGIGSCCFVMSSARNGKSHARQLKKPEPMLTVIGAAASKVRPVCGFAAYFRAHACLRASAGRTRRDYSAHLAAGTLILGRMSINDLRSGSHKL